MCLRTLHGQTERLGEHVLHTFVKFSNRSLRSYGEAGSLDMVLRWIFFIVSWLTVGAYVFSVRFDLRCVQWSCAIVMSIACVFCRRLEFQSSGLLSQALDLEQTEDSSATDHFCLLWKIE